MTVCVAVKVHDCLIFAADSASSLTGATADGEPVVLNVWAHGNKVFNLYKTKPIVAMTCGMGHMGPASISNLAKDLRRKLGDADDPLFLDISNYSIGEVAEKALSFFQGRYEAIDPPLGNHGFEFWVGGYGANCDNAEIWKISLQNGDWLPIELIAGEDQDGHVSFGGQPQAINRLLLGFDPSLGDALAELGMPEQAIPNILEQLQARLATPLVHPAMPIQDAINLADFLVDLTKRYFAFLPNADIVGGATDIATVTKHEGFKWIVRKHHYDAALNPRETDHV